MTMVLKNYIESILDDIPTISHTRSIALYKQIA